MKKTFLFFKQKLKKPNLILKTINSIFSNAQPIIALRFPEYIILKLARTYVKKETDLNV